MKINSELSNGFETDKNKLFVLGFTTKALRALRSTKSLYYLEDYSD